MTGCSSFLRAPALGAGCRRFNSYPRYQMVCSLTGKASTLQVERCGFDSHQYPLWCLKSKWWRRWFVMPVIAGSTPVRHPRKMPLNGRQLQIEHQGRVTPRGSIPPSSLHPPEAEIVTRTADNCVVGGAVPP